MSKTFIIAEMACSHEGNIDLALSIVDGAYESGADAIQLQIWELSKMMTPLRPEYNFLKKIELEKSSWISIVKYTRQKYRDFKMQEYDCIN